MGQVFAAASMSIDGFIAPEGMDMDHADDPGYKNWMARWMELQQWAFCQKFFRENLEPGEGGETGSDNRLLEDSRSGLAPTLWASGGLTATHLRYALR